MEITNDYTEMSTTKDHANNNSSGSIESGTACDLTPDSNKSFDSERFKQVLHAEIPRSGLIPEACSIGLFKKTLSSRKRLCITTCILLCLTLLILTFSDLLFWKNEIIPYISIIGTIVLLILSLVTGYLLALTIGDFIFPGPWREKMRRGTNYSPDNLKDQKALLRNKDIYFYILCALCIAGVIFGGDAITGKHFQHQFSVGGVISLLKSDNPKDRLAGIDIIASPLRQRDWEKQDFRDTIANLLEDPNDEVAAFATYCAGSMNLAEYADQIIANLQHNSPEVRKEAAYSLGRMEWKLARTPMLIALEKAYSDPEKNADEIGNYLFSFTLMQDSTASSTVNRILKECFEKQALCSDDILKNAFYFNRIYEVKSSAEISLKYLTSDKTSLAQKCYAAHALRMTGSASIVEELKAYFETVEQNAACDMIYRQVHGEAVRVLFESEPLRAVILRAIGNPMLMSNYDWIWKIGANEEENPSTRKVAELYTRALLKKKDNRQ